MFGLLKTKTRSQEAARFMGNVILSDVCVWTTCCFLDWETSSKSDQIHLHACEREKVSDFSCWRSSCVHSMLVPSHWDTEWNWSISLLGDSNIYWSLRPIQVTVCQEHVFPQACRPNTVWSKWYGYRQKYKYGYRHRYIQVQVQENTGKGTDTGTSTGNGTGTDTGILVWKWMEVNVIKININF